MTFLLKRLVVTLIFYDPPHFLSTYFKDYPTVVYYILAVRVVKPPIIIGIGDYSLHLKYGKMP